MVVAFGVVGLRRADEEQSGSPDLNFELVFKLELDLSFFIRKTVVQ